MDRETLSEMCEDSWGVGLDRIVEEMRDFDVLNQSFCPQRPSTFGLYDNFGAVDLGPAALGAGGGRDKGGQGKGEGEESRAQHNGPI